MRPITIKEFTNEPYVRITAIAYAISIIISYLIYDNVLSFSGLAIMLLSITVAAFALSNLFPRLSLINTVVVGSLSYGAYVIIMLFFKLTIDNAILYDELASAIIFGGISAATYWALKGK